MIDPVPTRAEALARLDAFRPRMGRRYAAGRNTDAGPGAHRAVSGLSPWISRRLLTEPEVIAAALDDHGPEEAEKFVQEVVWRGYFKGWLEQRPQVWDDYRRGLEADLAGLEADRARARAVRAACDGRTGLDCMDAWAEELVTTGYLHNHARMWFASIWIFTLDLPWRVGADFFYRHLLDGDAASNTLSWRWVAGLHTRGKPYAADAQNIRRFTNGRFAPRPSDLAEVSEGLESTEPDGLPPLQPLRRPVAPDATLPTALLITDQDCCVEDFAPDRLPLVGRLPDFAAAGAIERLRDVPRHPGLYGLLGYASRGLIWAPLAAELLAAQLEGEPLPLEMALVDALDPARFVLRARRSSRAPAGFDDGV